MNAKSDGSINGAYTRIHEAERSDDRMHTGVDGARHRCAEWGGDRLVCH